MYSFVKKTSCVLFLGLMTACASESSDTDNTTPQTDSSGAATNVPSTGAVTQTAQQAGEDISDAEYKGLVSLGTNDGWTLFFDKDSNHVVATNGKSTVEIDPNSLEDEKVVASLVSAGIPETLLWSWKGVLCRAACWGAAAAGCAAVAATCAVGTVITIGGFALPCTWAVVAACGASGGGASVCSDWCSSKYG